MDAKLDLTPAEERVFDETLVSRYDLCLRAITERGLEGCAQLANEQARALIEARRRVVNER